MTTGLKFAIWRSFAQMAKYDFKSTKIIHLLILVTLMLETKCVVDDFKMLVTVGLVVTNFKKISLTSISGIN